MKTAKQIVDQHLSEGKVVQLATSNNDIPWICSVYYVVDEKQNIYWLSYKSRRHSLDIAANRNVALTLMVRPEMPVIGIQAQGVAMEINRASTVAKVMLLYIKKYGTGKNFYKNFTLKTNKHSLYCFMPSKFVLFDEQTFGPDNAQEMSLEPASR